jgi:hypothetical protein
MGWAEERKQLVEERRRRQRELVPDGRFAWLDRGAWSAMAQEEPGAWSWTRALLTIGSAMVLAVTLYLLMDLGVAFLVGLALAYAFLLWRARTVHTRYIERRGTPGA